ncbi:MAG TPA: hypothetical protein V6C65_02835 [Allocoleopsis sp.]
MSGSNSSGCVSVLNQQRQQVAEHHNHCIDQHCIDRHCIDRHCSEPKPPCNLPQPKKCTVVENGRVVVKFIAEPNQTSQTDCAE